MPDSSDRPSGSAQPGPAQPGSGAPGSASGAAAVPGPARPPWLWAAVALAVLAVAAIVVFYAVDRQDDQNAGTSPSTTATPSGSAGAAPPESGVPPVGADGWQRRDQLQTPRDDFGTVVLDGEIWVVGGMTGERGNKLSSSETYDPVEDQWVMGPAMPTPRSSLAAAEVDGVIYAIGGSGVEPTLNVAEALDTATGEWTRVAPMPTPRYEHGAVVLDGKIWVIGGSEDAGGPRAVPTATVEIYDPATDRWTTGPPLAVARSSLRTVLVDGKIYAAGGFDQTNQPSAVVEVFDPATGAWQAGPPMPEPLYNFGFGAYEGELHAIYHEHHFVLRPGETEWRVESPPTIRRHGQGLIELDGLLYGIGGCTEEPLVDVNTVQVWQG